MAKILIIEDNHDVNKMLAGMLEAEGHTADSVYTGTEGACILKKHVYDLILMDLMLPYKSGDVLLKELREFSQVPVIVISAKDMTATKIDLLKLGADDYVTKPFDLGEVAARVEAQLRRSQTAVSGAVCYTHRDLTLDTGKKQLTVAGNRVELTAKEYQILELLMEYPGKVFSKSNLYQSVWGEAWLGDDNAVKTHISNLRTRLKQAGQKDYIETVWGMGYRLHE